MMVGQTLGNPQTLPLKEAYGTLAFGFPDASATEVI